MRWVPSLAIRRHGGESVIEQAAVVVPLAVKLAAKRAGQELRECLVGGFGVADFVEGHDAGADSLVERWEGLAAGGSVVRVGSFSLSRNAFQ